MIKRDEFEDEEAYPVSTYNCDTCKNRFYVDKKKVHPETPMRCPFCLPIVGLSVVEAKTKCGSVVLRQSVWSLVTSMLFTGKLVLSVPVDIFCDGVLQPPPPSDD